MRDLSLVPVRVVFTPANAIQRARDFWGFAKVSINGAPLMPGYTVRRTQAGGFVVEFPKKVDQHGRHHDVMELSPAERRSIEAQVLAALRDQGVLP